MRETPDTPEQNAQATSFATAASESVAAGARSWLPLVGLLVVVAAVNTLCMPAAFYLGDPSTWREEARSILQGHLHIEPEVVPQFGNEAGQYVVLNETNGQYYSKYGIVNSLVSIPPFVVQWVLDGKFPDTDHWNLLIFNFYQIVLCLVACALLYALTGRYTQRPVTRVAYVLAVFYGTFFWYFQRAQSSELYLVIFFVGLYLCLMKYLDALARSGERVGRAEHAALVGAWAFAGAMVLCRVLFGVLLPAIVIVVGLAIWKSPPARRGALLRREWAYLLIPPVVILAVLGWVNAVKFGSPWLTGYHRWRPEQHFPNGSFWDGLYGFTFDMQGGMFWYFPVMIFAVLGLRRFWQRHALDAVTAWILFGLPFVYLCFLPTWLGEWTYGPRYILFGLPVLALPAIGFMDGVIEQPRRWVRWAVGGAAAAILLYSAYLGERANRLNFFTYYQLAGQFEKGWNKPISQYFLLKHRGAICADLWACRDNLDEFQVMKDLQRAGLPPQMIADFRIVLDKFAHESNYYWWARESPPRNDTASPPP